jgi:hypothetical protein
MVSDEGDDWKICRRGVPEKWGKRLRLAAIALSLFVLVCPAFSSQSEQGWLCISPVPERPPSNVPGLLCNLGKLRLRVDTRDPVLWPRKESLKIDNLDLTQSHLVVASCDGKPIQSFRFHFSDLKASGLCLTFQDMFDGYEGMRLWDAKRAPWCKKCK